MMRDLAAILNKKRVRRGSIDFDLPEALIEFDTSGEMSGVRPKRIGSWARAVPKQNSATKAMPTELRERIIASAPELRTQAEPTGRRPWA